MKKDTWVVVCCTALITTCALFLIFKDHVLQTPSLSSDTTTSLTTSTTKKVLTFNKTLKIGDSGEEVLKLKEFINLHFPYDGLYIDEENQDLFESDLKWFLNNFQNSNNLPATGEFDLETMKVFNEDVINPTIAFPEIRKKYCADLNSCVVSEFTISPKENLYLDDILIYILPLYEEFEPHTLLNNIIVDINDTKTFVFNKFSPEGGNPTFNFSDKKGGIYLDFNMYPLIKDREYSFKFKASFDNIANEQSFKIITSANTFYFNNQNGEKAIVRPAGYGPQYNTYHYTKISDFFNLTHEEGALPLKAYEHDHTDNIYFIPHNTVLFSFDNTLDNQTFTLKDIDFYLKGKEGFDIHEFKSFSLYLGNKIIKIIDIPYSFDQINNKEALIRFNDLGLNLDWKEYNMISITGDKEIYANPNTYTSGISVCLETKIGDTIFKGCIPEQGSYRVSKTLIK